MIGATPNWKTPPTAFGLNYAPPAAAQVECDSGRDPRRSWADSCDLQRGDSQLDRRLLGGRVDAERGASRGSTPRCEHGFPMIVAHAMHRASPDLQPSASFAPGPATGTAWSTASTFARTAAGRASAGRWWSELLLRAAAMHKHVMIAGIDADNAVSIGCTVAWDSPVSAIFMKWDSSSGAGSTWCSCNVGCRRQLTPL